VNDARDEVFAGFDERLGAMEERLTAGRREEGDPAQQI
jgi:hypothetical protein